MARRIPSNFSAFNEIIDINEQIVRDRLRLDVDNWARFRFAINVGVDATNLISTTRPLHELPEEVKDSYRELGKSHYEVVTSLGCMALCFDDINNNYRVAPLSFKRSLKDFYFHAGCLLDNLARLIYIINDPKAATEKMSSGKYIRHWIDWGTLLRRHIGRYNGFARLKKSRALNEILHIRNTLTHSWVIPTQYVSNEPFWPLAARRKREHPWPYDEPKRFRRYRRWLPLLQMLREDLRFLERLQSELFRKLIRNINRYERNNGVLIR